MHNIKAVAGLEASRAMNVDYRFEPVRSERGLEYICYAGHLGKELQSDVHHSKRKAKEDVCGKILHEWEEFQPE
ncbi:hypothetical protein EV182_004145, partial [Spiromyces aspiralis]